MPAFEKRDAIVRTKRTWLFGVSLLVFGQIFVVLERMRSGGVSLVCLAAVYVFALASIVAALYWRRERRGDLRADGAGLWQKGLCLVPRASVRAAHLHARADDGFLVRLVRPLRPVDVVVADEAEGRALLAAMRLDPESTVARYAMTHGTFRRNLARVGGITVLTCAAATAFLAKGGPVGHISTASLLVFEGAVLSVFLLLILRRTVRLSVGADGVRVGRRFGRMRFIPFAAITRAETDGTDVFLHLRDGTAIAMSNGAGDRFAKLAGRELGDESRGFVSRVNERLASIQREVPSTLPTLARGGRTTQDWLRDLRTSQEDRASYRASAVPREELWRVVEDPSALPTSRAGAAMVLRDALDDTDRARLRVAAEACAAPQLRVTLDAAASPVEHDQLIGILEELDDLASAEIAPSPRRAVPR